MSGRVLGSALVGGLLSLVLAAVCVEPVSATAPESDTGAAVVGGFGVGDALEAVIDDRDGGVRLAVPVADVGLVWDSRAVAAGDLTGFGPGWGLGVARIGVRGAVTVFPPSGGSYEADATQPSGLAGYGVRDLRFEVTPGGLLEARADGAADEIAYEYTLAELGGTTTYFDHDGSPVARIAARGARADWRWGDSGGRLSTIVRADGVVTELDWAREPGTVLVHPAANLPPADDGTARVWRVRLDGGRVDRVDDPAGGTISLTYRDELVSRLSTPSGAVTELAWRAYLDRVPRIEAVRTVARDGAALSTRHWRSIGDSLPSGWPEYGGEQALFFSGDQAFRYVSELSDGATSVRSTYRSLHTLETRDLAVSDGSGGRLLREHAFGYPAGEWAELPDPYALPGNWSRPIVAEVTHRDQHGAGRAARTEYEADEFGRTVREVDVDGTVTETEYAPGEAGEMRPPVGLAVRERVIGSDGSIVETRHTLDEARSAVIASETLAGDGLGALTVTGRTEFVVEPDGFVSEQRVFPSGDAGQTAVVTRWEQAIDLGRGERTVVETAAAGSDAEAATAVTTSLVHGGVVAEVDAVGNRSTVEYDALGRTIREVDAAGRLTTTAHERELTDGRNAVSATTPDGVTRTELLDALGRVARITDNLSGGLPTPGHERIAERRSYPDPATVEATDAWGATTIARQDVFGRPVETVAASGATTRIDYDDVANTVTTRVSPSGDPADAETVRVERVDAAGREVETNGTRADGVRVPRTTTDYDGLGRVLVTDDGALRTRIRYDQYGNAVQTVAGDSAGGPGPVSHATTPATRETHTERRFDGFGASVEKTLRAGDDDVASAGARELDELGRVRREIDPIGRENRFAYTPDGLRARTQAGSGQVVEHEYDPATRQLTATRTSSPVGADVRVEVERDERTDLPIAVFDPEDRAETEIRTRYDGFGNPLEVAYPDGRVIRMAYDEHGRREQVTDAAGRRTHLTHDETGRIVWAVQRASDAGEAPVVAEVEYRYDPLGRMQELRRGNGLTTTYTFTSVNEIATETTTRGDQVTSAREYEYDPNGRLVRRVDRVRDDTTGELRVAATTYAYDTFGRLVRSSIHDGDTPDATEIERTEYEVTVGGDIRSERIRERDRSATDDPAGPLDAIAPTTREFEYSPLGELLAVVTDGDRVTQEYDVAGNLVRAVDGTTYVYDAANRPVSEDHEAQRIDTGYWADGSRRQRAGAAGVVTFYWDGDTLATESHRDPTGADGTASYLIGTGRHARTIETRLGGSATETVYYGSDRHGNVTELTDASGRVVVTYSYGDYGHAIALPAEPAGPSGEPDGLRRNPFQYSGAYTEADGHLWLSVRSYDPASMRFTTMDEADLLNGYHYADLDPIMLVDPTGRSSQWDWTVDAALLAVAGVFAVGMALAGLFTGGWSLTALGLLGWGADAATMATSVYRIDAAARREVIDPALDDALLGGEALLTVVGIVAGMHTGALLPRALRLQQAERSLVFGLAPVIEYQSPLPKIGKRVIANRGVLTGDVKEYGNALFARARQTTTTVPWSERGAEPFTRRIEQVGTVAAKSISDAGRGSALTRPLLASRVTDRIEQQATFARLELSNPQRFEADRAKWKAILGGGPLPADWAPEVKVLRDPKFSPDALAKRAEQAYRQQVHAGNWAQQVLRFD